MRKILIAVYCIGTIVGVIHSCIDPFDYNPEQTERLLVVDGQFTPPAIRPFCAHQPDALIWSIQWAAC